MFSAFAFDLSLYDPKIPKIPQLPPIPASRTPGPKYPTPVMVANAEPSSLRTRFDFSCGLNNSLAVSFRIKSVSRCTSVTSSLIFFHSQSTLKAPFVKLNGSEESSGQEADRIFYLSPSFESSFAISAFNSKLYLGNGRRNSTFTKFSARKNSDSW